MDDAHRGTAGDTDPLGFRALRDRWRAVPDLTPPPLTNGQADAMSAALAADFDRFLREPNVPQYVADEALRRLASLIAWTTNRPLWMR